MIKHIAIYGAIALLLSAGNARADLFEAVNNGSDREVRECLDKGENINTTDEDGETPLHWAAAAGHAGITALLIERGADVNAVDEDGETPLYLAAYWGKTAAATVLLVHGADINKPDEDGETPLHWAVNQGHAGVVSLLIKHKAAIDAVNEDGETPLHWAAKNGNAEMARLLIENGADINKPDSDGQTALHKAVFWNKGDMAARLLAWGADPSITDDTGRNAYAMAGIEGSGSLASLTDPTRFQDQDLIAIAQDTWLDEFPEKEGYGTVGSVFSSCFSNGKWEVNDKNENSATLSFSGIFVRNGDRALFEAELSLDRMRKNGTGATCRLTVTDLRINRRDLSDEERSNMLFSVFLGAKD